MAKATSSAKSNGRKTAANPPSTNKKAPVTDKKNEPVVQNGFPTDAAVSLRDLYETGLREMLWSENQLVVAIPKLIDAAADGELKNGLKAHLKQTMEHAARLEQLFEASGKKVIASKCDAMEGLVMSGEHIIDQTPAGTEVRDAGIIMASLKVENFEITAYQGLIQLANALGENDAITVLEQNMNEEDNARELLNTQLEDLTAAA